MDSAYFAIEFDNPQALYYAGQTVTGRVKLINIFDIYCCEVKVTNKGLAHTSITNHDDIRFYFNSSAYPVESGDSIRIPAGTHTYPFDIPLDPRLPSSFLGKYGRVEYYVEAVIKLPEWRGEVKLKENFEVQSVVDFNSIEMSHFLTEIYTTYRLGILGYPSGTVNSRVNILKSGYFPGETFPIECTLMNLSHRNVKRVELSVVMKVQFFAHDNVSTSTTAITTAIVGPGVVQGDFTTLMRELKIPEDTLVTNLNCDLIKWDYFLKVKIVISGPHINRIKYIPIIIGSVERYEDDQLEALTHFSDFAPREASENIELEASPIYSDSVPTQLLREDPLPSYWEVVLSD